MMVAKLLAKILHWNYIAIYKIGDLAFSHYSLHLIPLHAFSRKIVAIEWNNILSALHMPLKFSFPCIPISLSPCQIQKLSAL